MPHMYIGGSVGSWVSVCVFMRICVVRAWLYEYVCLCECGHWCVNMYEYECTGVITLRQCVSVCMCICECMPAYNVKYGVHVCVWCLYINVHISEKMDLKRKKLSKNGKRIIKYHYSCSRFMIIFSFTINCMI